jgi:hypothetical protein
MRDERTLNLYNDQPVGYVRAYVDVGTSRQAPGPVS